MHAPASDRSPGVAPAAPSWARWPLPAVATWIGCWALHGALLPLLGPAGAALGATLVGALASLSQAGLWRRVWVALGFPASALALGSGLPPWGWLLPLAVLASAYPLRAWRDAPLFPTPPGALDALGPLLRLPPGASVHDAGCGLGHGLRALRSAWPAARVSGVEWSWPLALLARALCRGARVRRGDMWADSWAGHDLVYVFQRPESMARAWAKACGEMAPGAWLVSLEFAVPDRAPEVCLPEAGGRGVRAWRVPPRRSDPHA